MNGTGTGCNAVGFKEQKEAVCADQVEIKKTKMEVLEVVSAVSTVSIKERNISNVIELSVPSTLSQEGSMVMKNLLEVMTYVGYLNDVDFRNVADKHKLRAAEDINRKVVSVLVVPPYKVQRYWNVYCLQYDVFLSENMRCMAKMLRDVMKPGA